LNPKDLWRPIMVAEQRKLSEHLKWAHVFRKTGIRGVPLTWKTDETSTTVFDENGDGWVENGHWHGPELVIQGYRLRRVYDY
jgi:hypothetical protein